MLKEPFLKRIYLEITNICNQSCPFCPQTVRAPQFMAPEDFHLILSKLQGHTKHLYFHVLGEPLLHPDLPTFLDEAHTQGFRVNLVTNGALIGQVGPELKHKPALRQVSFSLHSLAHQGPEIAQERLDKILRFIDAMKNTPVYCSLRLWTGGIIENLPVLDRLSKHFSLNFDLISTLENQPLRGVPLRERVFLNPAEEFDWPSLQAPIQEGPAFCHGLKQQLAILVDGRVVPCCLDGEGDITLGNVFETKLAKLWQEDRSQDIIQGFEQGQAVEELCQRCGYRTRFTIKKDQRS